MNPKFQDFGAFLQEHSENGIASAIKEIKEYKISLLYVNVVTYSFKAEEFLRFISCLISI